MVKNYVQMKKYYRIMLGEKSRFAEQCRSENFVGANFDIEEDLTPHLTENWREFNKKFIPVWLSKHPDKNKIAAGLSCGALWTIAKGLSVGDTVICPNGTGSYYVGEVEGGYTYYSGHILPHRRAVKWQEKTIDRADMSDALKNSTGSIGTVSEVSRYADEIEALIGVVAKPVIIATDETIEDATTFALEKHLEEFLVSNWKQTELGKNYDIFELEDRKGQQFPTDTGNIDVLAISKDKKELLVVELKKGRASDAVVGQIQRYMGYVLEELAEETQNVKGVIIALEDDNRIRRALAVAKNIEFYRYQVNFKLFKS